MAYIIPGKAGYANSCTAGRGGSALLLSSLGISPVCRAQSHTQSQSMSILCYKPTIGSYLPSGTLVDDNLGSRLNSLSFTIKAMGGYWSASFTINDRLVKLEDWLDRLGYHIEIYSPSLIKVWEGFIVNAFANVGGASVERGPFTEIGNKVATVYSTVDSTTTPPTVGMRAKTTYATDATSQGRYGIVEKHVSVGGASATTAAQIRDVWLEENKKPTTGKTFNSNSGATDTGITIECLGYVWWLNSYVYNQTANTGTLAISTILQNVLAADPNGVFSTDYSGITANAYAVQRYVNDDNLAWNYIKSLVSKGDTNDNRYLFGIYNDRKAYYAAIPTEIKYLQRLADPKQRIELTNGIEVKPWDVRPGKWSQFTDFLIGKLQGDSLRDDERNVFIEQTTFSIPWSLSYTGSKVSTLDQKLSRLGLGGTE